MDKAVFEFRMRRYQRLASRMDADDDETGGGAMYRLPYGLCNNAGIDTTGMSPTDAWNALKDKTGFGHDEALKQLKDNSKAKSKKIKSLSKSIIKYQEKVDSYGSEDDYDTQQLIYYAGHLKEYRKDLKNAKNNLEYYTSEADYWEKASQTSYEEWYKNHEMYKNLWGYSDEEMRADYDKNIADWTGIAKTYRERAKDNEEKIATLTPLIEKAENYAHDKKMLVKKQAELETLKHTPDYFNEQTAEKGKEAKAAYISKKKGEWDSKVKSKVEEMLKLDESEYSGIWKDKTVRPSEYEEYKDSIEKKRAYYEMNLHDPDSDADKVARAQEKLKQLDDFEEKGKQYQQLSKELAKTQAKASKWGAQTLGMAEKRMKDTPWKTKQEAYDTLISGCVDVWTNASMDERKAAHRYTGNFSPFNEPLRGIEYGTSEYKGVDNIDFDHIGKYDDGQTKKDIINLTNMISRSECPEDMWLQRGVGTKGASKLLGVSQSFLQNATTEDLQSLVGTTPTELGFCSCATAKGSGFAFKDVILNIFAPKGTKMLYTEPFSQYGSGAKSVGWGGSTGQSDISDECETLLQQGTKFRVAKAYVGSKIYFDLVVIGDNPKDLTKV